MMKPVDFDNEDKKVNYEMLEEGIYLVKILNVQEMTSRTGKPMLKVSVDIESGKHENFFMKQYKLNNYAGKKWSNNAVKYVVTVNNDGSTSWIFKKFIKACEEAEGSPVQWGENNELANSLKGKVIPAKFIYDVYVNDYGEEKRFCKIDNFISWDEYAKYFKSLEPAEETEAEAENDEDIEY